MDIYAVTGMPVAHSLSPQLFNHAFMKEGIEAVYTRLGADSAGEALEIAKQIGIRGLNVTAPFKEEMAGLMDDLDSEAQEIGAVNGVVFSGGRILGFNTDGHGVTGAFKLSGVEVRGREAVVLGTGGAGRAAIYALIKEGAKVRVVNRTFSKAAELARRFGCRPEPLENLREVIANAEVVLSAVSINESFVKPDWFIPGQVILDANYRNSRLSEIAVNRGCRVVNGTDWLLSQAVPAFEFFTGRRVEAEGMKEALCPDAVRERNVMSISLVGMMGTGKTAIGKELASTLGLDVIDTDEAIEKETGSRISWIFEHYGEEFFRNLENFMVKRLGREKQRKVYALGGGAVSNPESRDIVKSRSFVIWLWADPEVILKRIPSASRPLLETIDRRKRLDELMFGRLHEYARASDLIINAGRSPEDIVRKIIDEIH